MTEVEEYRSISMKGKAKRKDVSPITQQYGALNSATANHTRAPRLTTTLGAAAE